MAVDTRAKRFSMLNLGDGGHLQATFEADGAVDLDDRQHLLDCYSGIAFDGEPVAPTGQPRYVGMIKDVGRGMNP